MARTRIPAPDLARFADLAVRSLSRLGPLAEAEEQTIAAEVADADIAHPEEELVAEGQVLRHPRMILEGWAARVHVPSSGRRQILSFLLAGDIIGLSARPRSVALSSTIALTQVAVAPMRRVQDAISPTHARPGGLAAAAWNAIGMDETVLLNHLVRLGLQSSYERVAHLFLELFFRLRALDLVKETSFRLPLTQEILSDALGISVVHTNRTLQQMRRDGLVDYAAGLVTLHQLDKLAEISDFPMPTRKRGK